MEDKQKGKEELEAAGNARAFLRPNIDVLSGAWTPPSLRHVSTLQQSRVCLIKIWKARNFICILVLDFDDQVSLRTDGGCGRCLVYGGFSVKACCSCGAKCFDSSILACREDDIVLEGVSALHQSKGSSGSVPHH